jgi:catechol 2,3-dioxygenase-like lactoylglutathione lyase family enzyme
VKATLDKAFGYQGDPMNLPTRNLTEALPFYESALGFELLSRSDEPHASAVLRRDSVQMRLVENGGDPEQDGCAFHVTGIDALFAEFQKNHPGKHLSEPKAEFRDGAEWTVFFVVAPDGLCYWFGERKAK